MKLHGGSGQVSVLGRCEGVAKLPECELHSFFRGDASGLIILSFFYVVKYFSCAVIILFGSVTMTIKRLC
jgi:hypothetical protein